MYTTGAWSVVYALDAVNGEVLWRYDPQVPPETAAKGCCGVVNRGVAVSNNKVYLGAFDGRLICLSAVSGEVLWETQTVDTSLPYTITGAPRIVKDRVIIGNGGAELGVRGYVSAYHADTGEMLWRFFTVPGDPASEGESETVEMIAKTWLSGEWWKDGGGGGTVWDSMAYDPELNLLYLGVGNGHPWNQYVRDPGGGDNLFLASIVAINPDDGSYVWHYQTTPAERWDFTATQHMILADLNIDGVVRKVIMQAPKNGFFYVLDRESGEFISAEKIVKVTWASHIDPDTGRPVLDKDLTNYKDSPKLIFPSSYGAHNWHPMSFHPPTGLVYIPTQDVPGMYAQDTQYRKLGTRINIGVPIYPLAADEFKNIEPLIHGTLKAWNPVTQQLVWKVEQAGPWNGGLLSTAGNLVFQGQPNGQFVAYSAANGDRLWSFDAQTGVMAAPITYSIAGVQYVTVMAGWGGGYSLSGGQLTKMVSSRSESRVLTFKLGGLQKLPAPMSEFKAITLPNIEQDPDDVARGSLIYHSHCQFCHGNALVAGGTLPDLRYMDTDAQRDFMAITYGGALRHKGMVGFADRISLEDVENVRSYITHEANIERKNTEASLE